MVQQIEQQNKVYLFIKDYFSTNGKAPTLIEIAQALEISSTPSILFHLRSLEKKGTIIRDGAKRGMIIKEELFFARVPILGIANASIPLAAAEQSQIGYLQIDNRIIRNNGNLFAVKINGDSMNRQALNDSTVLLKHGNYAVIDKKAEYRQNDVVLAIINGGATIKIYTETNDGVLLLPNSTNNHHHPIYVKDKEQLVINGKVIMVFERPRIY